MVEDDDRPTATMEAPASELEETTQDTRLGPGTDVGGYVIDGEIGKGGMGFVYSATHPVIGKRAAIKVLKPEVSKSPIVVERFIQEARAVNQIQHPNIIDIFAFGTLPDGRAYHVMDLLHGETLRKRLRRGAFHPTEAASVIDETASALMAAHDKGFVHRDLKPDNIFLVEHDGRWPEVKLLDFGLAKLMPEAGIAPFTTKAGAMLGTPEYMSPEQARGTGVDHRTDIYALGVVTFELLAGRRPFASYGDAFAMVQAHVEEPPPSLRDMIPTLPEEMTQLVDAMLAKAPAARPSLAAVRTVIKRLRRAHLPTRTAAGLEIASFQGTSNPGSLGITASQVGAHPMLLGSTMDEPAPLPSQLRIVQRSPSQPPPTSPRAPSQPPVPSAPSYPPRAHSPSVPGSNPPSPRTHGANPPDRARPGSIPPMPAGSMPMPGFGPNVTPSSGLAQDPHAPKGATTLGVAPPPVRVPSRAQPVAKAKSTRLWLVIGALLAIGAGVALALVLAGT